MRGFLVVFGVLALAVGLGLGFFLSDLGAKPVHLPTTTDLAPVSAQQAWRPMDYNGYPPADVMAGIVIPSTAAVTGYDNIDRGATQYDRSVTFFVPASERDTLGFYAIELPSLGWKIRNANPTPDGRGTRLLAYRYSSDSYEWDLQVSIEPAARGGRSGSQLVIETYQVSDANG